ncbi:MAG TPA: sigma-54 dependent transcriptional regulator [Alphaproteobacteria bacterium]|nr:sigma-54 dependent transcriptional regulator [Alphaproteobacteria bacterium]
MEKGKNSNNTADKTDCPESFGRFIGTSSAMLDIYKKIENIAPTDTPVFITGESGTGKEVTAQALHYYSDRREKPFIAVNCATFSGSLVDSAIFGHVKGAFTGADQNRAGAIEQAEGGTLFLDEICEMPLETQAKLLRFTQDLTYQKLGSDVLRKADIRIICATNCNPAECIKDKHFREDLYYRLNVFPITMPPLRNRGEDVIDLAYFYLEKYAAQIKSPVTDFSQHALHLFCLYDWPGNIRELQNLIRQLVATTKQPIITETTLPDHIQKCAFHKKEKAADGMAHISMPLWKIEKRAIEQAITLCGGNIPKAAGMLDISPSTIYRKIQSWQDK